MITVQTADNSTGSDVKNCAVVRLVTFCENEPRSDPASRTPPPAQEDSVCIGWSGLDLQRCKCAARDAFSTSSGTAWSELRVGGMSNCRNTRMYQPEVSIIMS